jgi:coenzyme PQQ precursor peptide PqqA
MGGLCVAKNGPEAFVVAAAVQARNCAPPQPFSEAGFYSPDQLACSGFCGYVVFGCIATSGRGFGRSLRPCGTLEELIMRWSSPRVVEICVGMEINCYASAEV